MGTALTASFSLRTWLGYDDQSTKDQNEKIVAFDALVKDAGPFVRYFGMPMAQSAPHVYLSALPFAPSSSARSNLYAKQISAHTICRVWEVGTMAFIIDDLLCARRSAGLLCCTLNK